MKNLIKKFLPSRLSSLIGHFIHIETNPYSLALKTNKVECISDFFVYSNSCYENHFIVENIRALIAKKKINVNHIFRFFSEEGKFIKEMSYQTNDFASKIKLINIESKSKYISFTHHTEAANEFEDNLWRDSISGIGDCFPISRGTTVYYYKKGYGGSAAHGNFGGISNKNQLYAKLRSKFAYTPIPPLIFVCEQSNC